MTFFLAYNAWLPELSSCLATHSLALCFLVLSPTRPPFSVNNHIRQTAVPAWNAGVIAQTVVSQQPQIRRVSVTESIKGLSREPVEYCLADFVHPPPPPLQTFFAWKIWQTCAWDKSCLDGTCLCIVLSIVFILNLLFRRLNQRERDALQKNFLCCSAYLLHFGGSKSSGSLTSSFVVIYHFHFYRIWPQLLCDLFSCWNPFFHFYRIWPQRPSRSCGTCVYKWSWVSKVV